MIPNQAAFCSMLSHSEGTDRAADPYRVVYGYEHTIVSLADHPAVTGEWKGARLPDQTCIAAGFSPGCVSTAAGRYQITKPTWVRLKGILRLANFGPEAQDDACLQLIKERGALDLVNSGAIAQAVRLCRSEWASLPGGTSGQPEQLLANLLTSFTGAGGVLA
jgi:lysozyme